MSLWSERCCIDASSQSQHLSVKKTKNEKKHSKSSLIRPNCVRKHFWSDPSALEEVMIRPNCAPSSLWSNQSALEEVMIRPNCAQSCLWSDFSDQIDLWPDHLQTIVQTVVRSNFRPDPVISVLEHTVVRSTGSDHKPIWVWTSTWGTNPWFSY